MGRFEGAGIGEYIHKASQAVEELWLLKGTGFSPYVTSEESLGL
jgi:hypothetical protein